jgi:hypothetical protein
MRMFTAALAASGLLVASAPAFADATPDGHWRCVIGGAAAGELTVLETSYIFAAPAGAPREGALSTVGNIVYVTSGPLKDALGITLGYFAGPADLPAYYARGDWMAELVFNMGPGKAMACAPSYPDPALL